MIVCEQRWRSFLGLKSGGRSARSRSPCLTVVVSCKVIIVGVELLVALLVLVKAVVSVSILYNLNILLKIQHFTEDALMG